jgi:hypothetical protein
MDRTPAPAHRTLEVRRSGGLAGRTASGSLDLDADDPRAAEARALLHRVDLAALAPGVPMPDMHVYSFVLGSRTVSVPEQDLPAELRRLAELTIDPDDR